MCLIAFAYQVHPDYPLILAANRDEFYERPTTAAHFWNEEEAPHLLAGKDLEAGGTWMGVHTSHKWAALTNYRDPYLKRDNPPSRGTIIPEYLQSSLNAAEYVQALNQHSDHFMGFNVLVGDSNELFHYSNASKFITPIQAGIHGVSNATLNTSWPKLDWAKSQLEKNIRANQLEPNDFFAWLTNNEQAEDALLPETGIPYKWEKAVSSVFIKTESYGTRCSTILLIDKEGSIQFTERRYVPQSSQIKEENTFRF